MNFTSYFVPLKIGTVNMLDCLSTIQASGRLMIKYHFLPIAFSFDAYVQIVSALGLKSVIYRFIFN